jgi:hypothetical protein
MPPQNPVTRLRQVAIELGQFADVLDADTDLDPQVLRHWQTQLLDIAPDLERLRPVADPGSPEIARR